MTLDIRLYKKEDLSALLTIWWRASCVAHPFLKKSFLQQEAYNIVNIYMPITETWVAYDQTRMIGFISLMDNEVGAIFIEPDFHRQGVGTALMHKAVSLRGSLEVEVFKENKAGFQFYNDYGFITIKEKVHDKTNLLIKRMRYTHDQT